MTEQEALQRMRENDRSFAEHRATQEHQHRRIALAEHGREPADPKPLAELLRVPPEFDRPPTSEEARQRAEADADGARLRRMERALSCVPPKLRAALLGDAVEETEAVRLALGWFAEGRHRVLLIRGGVGVGKSMAAAAAMRASVQRGERSVSWHRPNDFVSAMLHSYDPKAPALGDDFVVVDDLGRETKQDFEEALCTFLEDKTARAVLTTNMKSEEFRERYDERLLDRLRECCAWVPIKGASRRVGGGGF